MRMNRYSILLNLLHSLLLSTSSEQLRTRSSMPANGVMQRNGESSDITVQASYEVHKETVKRQKCQGHGHLQNRGNGIDITIHMQYDTVCTI